MLILHVWKICEMPKAAPENGKCHSFVFTDTIAPITVAQYMKVVERSLTSTHSMVRELLGSARSRLIW